MIKTRCPACNQAILADYKQRGLMAKCPHCEAKFVVETAPWWAKKSKTDTPEKAEKPKAPKRPQRRKRRVREGGGLYEKVDISHIPEAQGVSWAVYAIVGGIALIVVVGMVAMMWKAATPAPEETPPTAQSGTRVKPEQTGAPKPEVVKGPGEQTPPAELGTEEPVQPEEAAPEELSPPEEKEPPDVVPGRVVAMVPTVVVPGGPIRAGPGAAEVPLHAQELSAQIVVAGYRPGRGRRVAPGEGYQFRIAGEGSVFFTAYPGRERVVCEGFLAWNAAAKGARGLNALAEVLGGYLTIDQRRSFAEWIRRGVREGADQEESRGELLGERRFGDKVARCVRHNSGALGKGILVDVARAYKPLADPTRDAAVTEWEKIRAGMTLPEVTAFAGRGTLQSRVGVAALPVETYVWPYGGVVTFENGRVARWTAPEPPVEEDEDEKGKKKGKKVKKSPAA